MTFDAAAPSTPAAIPVDPRERLLVLRDFLDALDDSKFDMRVWTTGIGDRHFMNCQGGRGERPEPSVYGAVCDIGGWTEYLFVRERPATWEGKYEQIARVGEIIGVEPVDAYALFYPDIAPEEWARITNKDAVRVIDHYLATGVIDWSARHAHLTLQPGRDHIERDWTRNALTPANDNFPLNDDSQETPDEPH